LRLPLLIAVEAWKVMMHMAVAARTKMLLTDFDFASSLVAAANKVLLHGELPEQDQDVFSLRFDAL
jgi:hypothetical protein